MQFIVIWHLIYIHETRAFSMLVHKSTLIRSALPFEIFKKVCHIHGRGDYKIYNWCWICNSKIGTVSGYDIKFSCIPVHLVNFISHWSSSFLTSSLWNYLLRNCVRVRTMMNFHSKLGWILTWHNDTPHIPEQEYKCGKIM